MALMTLGFNILDGADRPNFVSSLGSPSTSVTCRHTPWPWLTTCIPQGDFEEDGEEETGGETDGEAPKNPGLRVSLSDSGTRDPVAPKQARTCQTPDHFWLALH